MVCHGHSATRIGHPTIATSTVVIYFSSSDQRPLFLSQMYVSRPILGCWFSSAGHPSLEIITYLKSLFTSSLHNIVVVVVAVSLLVVGVNKEINLNK